MESAKTRVNDAGQDLKLITVQMLGLPLRFSAGSGSPEGDVLISTDTIEGYFSILKRGINGVYHHVGRQHLHRYLSWFDFRNDARHMEGGERCSLAIHNVSSKRLRYQDSSRP